ncbi:MAG: hypothetical protein LH471_09365 [Salinibacterium sp.]|nr:hypothetical protein [Salinibacterium sp.]
MLDAYTCFPFNSGLGVMMHGTAGLLHTETVLPRWLEWLALVLGIASFIPFADSYPLIVTLLRIILSSVV